MLARGSAALRGSMITPRSRLVWRAGSGDDRSRQLDP